MTTEHLIAWLAENLLAATFIGSGALLALLLATWPLRALWRWRHKPKRTPCVGDVFYGKSDSHFFAATYYVVQNVGPMGVQVARDDDPMNIKAYSHRELWSLKKWHKVTKGKLFAEGVRDVEPPATERQNKPVPTVFADARGYADSANAPDRVMEDRLRQVLSDYVRPCDLEPMIERLAALEAKEAPIMRVQMHDRSVMPFGPGYWGIGAGSAGQTFNMDGISGAPTPMVPRTGCFVSMDDALAGNGSTQLQSLLRKMRQRMDASDYHGPPAPVVPEVRVFRHFGSVRVFEGRDSYFKGSFDWGKVPSDYEDVIRWAGMGNVGVTELHGPAKDAIVAEWRAWRGKQG